MKPSALLTAATVTAAGPAALVSLLGRISVDSVWVERLGWTLIHTVWQFALVALAAAALHWSLRRRSTRVRYAAGVLLLGAMAVAPVVTYGVVDVSRPGGVKPTPPGVKRTPDEMASDDHVRFVSSMPESDAREAPVRSARPPRRRAAETLAANRAGDLPHERPSISWVAVFRNRLAPWLPLFVSLWLAGMALFSLRPVWGLWMQWRLRRVGLSSVPAPLAQCLDDLARRLGLRRTVGIAQSVCVGVPMAVGYLRPLILLPGCVLTGLTADQLQALLAHELAHVRRHDWLVNAFQVLVETVFFYHPAVWWLSRQIRQERENCCDDLAVSLVGDRGTVGRMLLAIEELRERTPGLVLAATGGNLLSRVRRVVAKGGPPEPAGREWLPATVLLLLAGLGSAAWAMSAGTAEKKNPPPTAPRAAAPASTVKAAAPGAKTSDVRRISGRIVDSAGQPIPAARLWWMVIDNYLDDRKFTIEGASDAQGRFALEAPAAWKPRQPSRVPADMLWVLAPGKDLKVVRATDGLIVKGKDPGLVIALAPATETEYEIRDEQGHPVAGAVVEPWHFRTPRAYEYLPTGIRAQLGRTTDQSGRARLISLPRELLYQLQVGAVGFGTQQQRLDGLEELFPQRKVILRTAGRIEGRLIADDPRWVRGVKLLFRTERWPWKRVPITPSDGTNRQRIIWETEGEALVETDQQGRFRIAAIAAGRGSIMFIDGPSSSPLAPRMPSELLLKPGETAHVDISMENLVPVKGTIRTDDTNMPVAGAVISVRYGAWLQGEMVISDGQGRYHSRVLPGPVYTQVMSMPPEIAARYEQIGDPWNKRVEVTAGIAEFKLPAIVLGSTETHSGTLIDQQGRPIAGARVAGIRGNRRYGLAKTNERGDFSSQLPKNLAMDSYEVVIPGRRHDRRKPTIVKYEPFTLQFDLRTAGENGAKSKHEADASGADKRQTADERGLASSSAPSLPTTNQPSIALAAAASKPSVGGPTITGKVHDSDGKPVADATVMIWSAGVKHGYSTYCPGCYADCGKRAVTDAAGAFAITHLDPELRFQLLIVREGYGPIFAEKVDPFGGPTAVTLSRRPLPDNASQVVHGLVVGPHGEPLAGAVVEAEAVGYWDEHGQSSHKWGAVKGLDPLAVTNEQGHFEIAYAKPARAITVMVRARGMAPQRFAELETGTERHTLALNHGASIRGRLVSHGHPVGRAEMGLVARDRTVDQFYSEVRIGTEPDGSFLFANVPVPGKWYVYAKMDSLRGRGATNAVECGTEREDETVNLGDVTLQRGHRLSGRVVLSDGKPIPRGMRIFASAERAWDSQTHDLPADGRFEFVGLPTDDFSINPAVKGYHPSPKNPNLNLGIDGFIDRDIDNFVILLDPGKDRFNRIGQSFRGKPLRGAPEPPFPRGRGSG